MDQELFNRIQGLQQASFFRRKTDAGDRIVNAPYLGSPIASAFERLSRYDDPAVEIARMGVHEIHHVCWGIDVIDDDVTCINNIPAWTRDGTINVRSMAGGRC